jgi:purine-binding chemotaxis protein CheW
MEVTSTKAETLTGQQAGPIEQFVVFELGCNEFAVPIGQVQEILVFSPLTLVPRVPEFIEGVINVRGKIIPVLDLCRCFGIQGKPRDTETRIIVVEVKGQTAGMVVDVVTEVVKIAHDTIEPPPPLITTVAQKFLIGIGKIGSRVLVILNLDEVLNPEELLELGKTGATLVEEREKAQI